MSTFFKTFFICLVATFSFLVYQFVSNESYTPELKVSKNNPVFTKSTVQEPIQANKLNKKNDIQKYEYSFWFYSNSGKLISLKREYAVKQDIVNIIQTLLRGPTILEERKGIYSEIPKNTKLLSIKQENNSVIVDLSEEFSSGGGTDSLEHRLKQLSKTIKNVSGNKQVYLYIEGKRVEYLGGEGVYVKQPIE